MVSKPGVIIYRVFLTWAGHDPLVRTLESASQHTPLPHQILFRRANA
jgi:hypothetical protein